MVIISRTNNINATMPDCRAQVCFPAHGTVYDGTADSSDDLSGNLSALGAVLFAGAIGALAFFAALLTAHSVLQAMALYSLSGLVAFAMLLACSRAGGPAVPEDIPLHQQ